MNVPSFGQAARLQAHGTSDRWLHWAGNLFWHGLLIGSVIWWNGLLDPHESLKQVIFGLVLALTAPFLFLALRQASGRRSFSWAILGALGLLFLSSFLSWASAPDRWLAAFGVAGSISTSLFLWISALTACFFAGTLRSLGWRPAIASVHLGLLFLIVSAFLQRFGLIDLSPGGPSARLFTPVGNEWALAWLVACVALATLAQEILAQPGASFFAQASRRAFLFAAAAYLFVIDQVFIWGALLVGLFFLIVLLQKRLREDGTALAWILVTGFLVAIGLILPIPKPFGLPSLAALSQGESWRVVQATWTRDGSIIGSGLGQWSAAFELVRPLALNLGSLYSIRFDVGGSFWWTVLLQQGILGGVAWIAFLALAGLQTVVNVREDEDLLPPAIGLWFALFAFFLIQPHGWALVWVFVAAGWVLANHYEAREKSVFTWQAISLALGLVLLSLLPFIFGRVLADAALRRAQAAVNVNDRRVFTQRATEYAPWLADSAFARLEADTAWIDEQIRTTVSDPVAFQRELSAAIERVKAANARWPQDPNLWLARGRLYVALLPITEGADQFALQAYQDGRAFAPTHPGFPLGMAQIFLLRASVLEKQLKEAETAQAQALNESRLEQLRLAAQWFLRALELRPDDRSVGYAYALTLARSGDVRGAIPLFAALWQEDPRRSDLTLEYATILAAAGQRSDAITLAQRISSQDPLFLTSQRLLLTWYEAEERWAEALAALRNFPAQEQKTPAFRQRVNRLQSKLTTPASR